MNPLSRINLQTQIKNLEQLNHYKIIIYFYSFLALPLITLFPEIHADEAALINIIQNSDFLDLKSMNSYTSNLFFYINYFFIKYNNYKLLTLRLISFCLNLSSFILCYKFLQRISTKESALYTTLFLISSPFYLIFSKFGTELASLAPVGIILFLNLYEEKFSKYKIIALIILGLTINIHLLLTTFAVSIIIYLGAKEKKLKSFVLNSTVLFICLIPKLISIPHILEDSRVKQISFDLNNQFSWIYQCYQLLDGPNLNLHFLGNTFLTLPPIYTFFFFILILFSIYKKYKFPIFQNFMIIIWCLGISLVVPRNSLRFFVLPLAAFIINNSTFAFKIKKTKYFILTFILFNVTILISNFYIPYLKWKDKGIVYENNLDLPSVSHHSIHTSHLISEIKMRGIKHLYVNDWFLKETINYYFLNPNNKAFHLYFQQSDNMPIENSGFLFYNYHTLPQNFSFKNRVFSKSSDSTHNFWIYTAY